MKGKSLIAIPILILGSLLAVSVLTRSTAADAELTTYYLGVGEQMFWDGEDGKGQYVPPCQDADCPSYEVAKLVTSGGGARLRVGLDLIIDKDGPLHPNARAVPEPGEPKGRAFRLQIINDQGIVVEEEVTDYSVELFLCFNRDLDGDGTVERHEMCETWRHNPQLCDAELFPNLCIQQSAYATSLAGGSEGSWTVKVIPENNSGWAFRVRAKLEAAPDAPASQPEFLPNLRAVPPFDLTFKEPLVSAGFFVGHTPVDGDGFTDQEKADYIADVTIEEGAAAGAAAANAKAIRFSAGPENVGPGQFEVRGSPEHLDSEGNYIAYQRTYNPNGSFAQDREAGALEYHSEHGHFHYNFFLYELYQLTRTHPTKPWKKIKLGERLEGDKVGFCPSDERLADWELFFQDRRLRWDQDRIKEFPRGNLSCISVEAPRMGLSVGWGDLYEWARVEQYIVFPTNADGSLRDGYYLLRATVDGEGKVVESNEDDNTSYALFKVTNGVITIIQRGYGPEP